MNYTTNYHLPQWVESDRIMMEDFNEAMDSIDQSIKAASLPTYVIGNYTGNGETQTIELGFRPKFVIITGQVTGAGMSTSVPYLYTLFSGGNHIKNVLKFIETGFSVIHEAQTYPDPNSNGKQYSY